MKYIFCTALLVQCFLIAAAQPRRDDIYTDFVLYNKRKLLATDLTERILAKNFSMTLDSDNEYRYESACRAVSQFHFANEYVRNGFAHLFTGYDALQYDTKRAFLDAVYAVYPVMYPEEIKQILKKEKDPRLFSMAALYLFRMQPNTAHELRKEIDLRYPGSDTIPVIQSLEEYLDHHNADSHSKTPELKELFQFQKQNEVKAIYSFQRWDRRYPGMAIVQRADGSFEKNEDGSLAVFQQLALSGSGLPWFISNGNTPQGIYSVSGTGQAHNNFIGPTPYIQMSMPFETGWEKFFHETIGPAQDTFRLYMQVIPPSWRKYRPMMESWNAGKLGRREIIAHGTTLDPEFFKDEPFYPLTPTMGCLCAKELWNPTNGRLLVSEQFNLVSAFQHSPGNKGFLFVINLDDQKKPVTRSELEALVGNYEKSLRTTAKKIPRKKNQKNGWARR